MSGRDEWNRVLRDAYRSDAMFRKLTNQIMAKRADTADKAGRNVVAASEEALVELYAAYKTGEYGVLNQKYGDLRSFVQRVFAALRQVLVKVLGKRFGRLSDYDLADALKNTIQDNQKLARMMDALDKVELAGKQANDGVRFDLYEGDSTRFARAIDSIYSGKFEAQHKRFINMGTTPDVLQMLGMPNTDVFVRETTIEKAFRNQLRFDEHGHNIDPETLKRLPEQLNDPIAVMRPLKDSTNPDSLLVLTELIEKEFLSAYEIERGIKPKDKPVIVALMLNNTSNGVEVINITTIHGRIHGNILEMLQKGTLYWNKEKGSQFLTVSESNFPPTLRPIVQRIRSGANPSRNVKTKDDLLQWKSYKNQQDDVQFSMDDAEQSSFDKTAKRLGGQEAYQEAFDKGDTVLSYRQWVQVRTPEFKVWFGDWENHPDEASKIINEETGEPLVVYHGAIDEFTVFRKTDTGSFFASSPEVASSYAVRYGDFETGFLDESNAPNVAAYFLNVRNPESVDANGSHFSKLTLPDGSVTTNETFARKAIERDADGVMIYNTRDDADPRNQSVSDVFTAKNAHAIKSAWGNTGAFDEANNDIRFSMDEVDNDTIIRWAGNRLKRIGQAVLDKSYISNEAVHLGKTPDVLAQIPLQIQKPLAVFDSATQPNAKVIVTELKDGQGKPVIVALHIGKKKGRGNQVNKIASVYGRNNPQKTFNDWFNDGLLLYLDNRKSHSRLESAGLQLPLWEKSKNGLLGSSVLLATDIVNQQAADNQDDVQFSLNEDGKCWAVRIKRSDIQTQEKQDADVEAVMFGQCGGLFDLPPVPITVIDTQGLPDDFKDMKKWADKWLRELQQAPIGTLHNEDMNWELLVGKKDRRKMGDNENLAHHTSQAVTDIVSLVRYAVLVETHQDKQHNNNHVKAVHRLYAPVEIDGKLYRTKLTVKDYVLNNGTERKNLHAIETIEIENTPMGIVPPNQNDQAAQPTSGRVLSVTDL